MNLFDSSFLCLDIGSTAVKAIAHRVKSGRLTKSAFYSVESTDTVFAIKSVVDELEKQIGARFDSAYITGNFGRAEFEMVAKSSVWSGEHKITGGDVRHQITQITAPDGFYPIHIIPLRYDTTTARNLLTPVGITDKQLTSVYGAIFYERDRLNDIFSVLRGAHIQAETFIDPIYLLDETYREKKQTAMFLDLGGEFTTVSIWTGRGPVFYKKIHAGQNQITEQIANDLAIPYEDAARIKHAVSSVRGDEMDRFTPADAAYDFSRADLNEILLPQLSDIIDTTRESVASAITKYNPSKIYLTGGGADIAGIDELIFDTFNIPVQTFGSDTVVRALSDTIWKMQAPRIRAYLNRRARWGKITGWFDGIFKRKKKKTAKFIPVMPTTLSFDMKNPMTYELFRSGNISMIHIDIMDGFFVDRIVGGVEDLKFIREHTNAHLYVHLMTESPAVWASAVASAGADTIIVSTNTAGVRAALRKIRETGKRCGIALNLESPVSILKPVLKEIDDILIMAIKPGYGGQKFDDSVLGKISTLVNTRKRYGLKFKITVDGGINPETAQMCWMAGADFVAAGSYLAHSADFPLAVQSLMPNA